MKRFTTCAFVIAMLFTACDNNKGNGEMPWDEDLNNKPEITTTAEIGKALPLWSEGCLDIHFINTGRGECCFYILPDGTTLLVDAGEIETDNETVAQRPNSTVRPVVTYASYIKHFLPDGKKYIDYCAPSHLHIDHIGSSKVSTETAPAGYRKAGLTSLFDLVPFKHILDRAYPDYPTDNSHATIPMIDGQLSKDWGVFVKWGVKEGKFTADIFTPGQKQITLLNNAEKYNNFSILNICANGFAWSKSGLVGKKSAEGNPASCGFHISYGPFDYIACGDLTSSAQNLMAQYFVDFIGDRKLEAFKCNHHLASNAWGSQMQSTGFNPRVVLNHCFSVNKPDPEKWKYVLDLGLNFFATNIHKDIQAKPEVISNKLLEKTSAYDGHIVLRVSDNGESFYVYTLDDTNFDYIVKTIHGPYQSK